MQRENGELLDKADGHQTDILNATDYIMNLEEKCYNANKLNIDLLAQLRDTSDEFLTLQRYIADL